MDLEKDLLYIWKWEAYEYHKRDSSCQRSQDRGQRTTHLAHCVHADFYSYHEVFAVRLPVFLLSGAPHAHF